MPAEVDGEAVHPRRQLAHDKIPHMRVPERPVDEQNRRGRRRFAEFEEPERRAVRAGGRNAARLRGAHAQALFLPNGHQPRLFACEAGFCSGPSNPRPHDWQYAYTFRFIRPHQGHCRIASSPDHVLYQSSNSVLRARV